MFTNWYAELNLFRLATFTPVSDRHPLGGCGSGFCLVLGYTKSGPTLIRCFKNEKCENERTAHMILIITHIPCLFACFYESVSYVYDFFSTCLSTCVASAAWFVFGFVFIATFLFSLIFSFEFNTYCKEGLVQSLRPQPCVHK